jgi:hypothetical protein
VQVLNKVNPTDIITISDNSGLCKVARQCGYESFEGMERSLPVVTITYRDRMNFMGMVHNQCLKLMYQLREENHPGDHMFANDWNTTNFMGTLIPLKDGYLLKHETLASHPLVMGNVELTLKHFGEAIDRFQDEWF